MMVGAAIPKGKERRHDRSVQDGDDSKELTREDLYV